MLYLYAITDARSPTDALSPGVNDVRPELLSIGGLSVVVAQMSAAPPRKLSAVRQHMDVLAALMPYGTVLPARFGTVLDTRDELDAAIDDMRGGAIADLERLRGYVELGLTVTDLAPAPVAPSEPIPLAKHAGPGALYMAAKRAEAAGRLARERANEALAARICDADSPLAGIAAETVWRTVDRPETAGEASAHAISIAFLIRGERVEAFRAALSSFRSDNPQLDFLCTGPWPPFSFVSVGSSLSSTSSDHDKPSRSPHC